MLQNKKVEVRHENFCTVYKYVNTDVIKVHDKYIQLNSGDWYTRSTKNLINEVIDLHNRGWVVFQTKGIWYCRYIEGQKVEFKDGIKLYNTGTVKYK